MLFSGLRTSAIRWPLGRSFSAWIASTTVSIRPSAAPGLRDCPSTMTVLADLIETLSKSSISCGVPCRTMTCPGGEWRETHRDVL